ncbi:hypothetical protein [Rhodococcus sp. JVH1]|uniref:hypothetical protein n=1 Tax=Rhodococcus sp. JVH1 TaxID=745408 RepID=UPI000271EB2A|nr:hypothetical protein [Rhodococcus sp. JVH1]EJI93540.1 hypothetical protein JVH1_9089 [Rhodococcus sp. JVH1]
MLSPYDELPIHQTPHPVSIVSNTDPSFDDGYYFGVFSPEAKVFVFQGMRINPNTDVVGGYVGINRDGKQRTVRFSRTWRELSKTEIGPYSIEVIEPFREIRLKLDENDSGISFDLRWYGSSPAFEEAHHWAVNRGRPTTDQTRYSQSGEPRGWIQIDGDRWEVEPGAWYASRDHSWGLYHERAPMAPDPKWLPPRNPGGIPRALRFWTIFGAGELSGFYGFHEDAKGRQVKMNDTFGTPFEGQLTIGWDDEVIDLVGGTRELEFVPGTRLLARATITLEDSEGGKWVQEIDPVSPPWVANTMGYDAGSWRDGGSLRTYHGPGVSLEWDEFDFSKQPFDHELYDGTVRKDLIGREYLSVITTTAPDGRSWTGAGQTELFLDGPYEPYGFTS